MASPIWTGAASGNWNTAGNWDTGSAPVGGDSVTFKSGSVDVTTGPSSAINLASLTVTNGYGGNWTDLVTLGTITALSMNGAGSRYRLSATVTTGVLDINPQTVISHEGGTWTTVTCSGTGNVERSGTGVWTTSYVTSSALKVTATSANQTWTTVNNTGTIITAGSIGTYNSTGNDRLTTTGAAAISTAATITSGAIFNHISSGTITLLNAQAGSSFPCLGCADNFTITTANIYAGSDVNERPAGITVTFGTKNYIGKNMAPGGNPL